MIQIIMTNKEEHAQFIRELFREYLRWANAKSALRLALLWRMENHEGEMNYESIWHW
jgi:hypothetical protein